MNEEPRARIAGYLSDPSESSGVYDDRFASIPIATYWPDVVVGDPDGEWEELREWVEGLQERFAHLDHHVVPRCWWRHNEHVELLCALRDHERCSYSVAAPATAPMEWFRALRDAASMLASWTADLGCSATQHVDPPRPSTVDGGTWDSFLKEQAEP